jgi:murein DD-endopeptidase MepM/ murein hydrolase activator NlpD
MYSLRSTLPPSLTGALLGSLIFAHSNVTDPPALGGQTVGQPAPDSGAYAWPVRGPVVRGFDEPQGPFAPGHRGIDIAAEPGTPVRAAQDGVVAFAGPVGGDLYVSVAHPDGIRTTYSWLSAISVRRGEEVRREAVLGTSGSGHPGVERPHLHFGARNGASYIDPLTLLERQTLVGLIQLAPLNEEHI